MQGEKQLGCCASGTQGQASTCGGCFGSLLRGVEGWHARRHFDSVKTPKGAQTGRGPIPVMRMQPWADSCGGKL